MSRLLIGLPGYVTRVKKYRDDHQVGIVTAKQAINKEILIEELDEIDSIHQSYTIGDPLNRLIDVIRTIVEEKNY